MRVSGIPCGWTSNRFQHLGADRPSPGPGKGCPFLHHTRTAVAICTMALMCSVFSVAAVGNDVPLWKAAKDQNLEAVRTLLTEDVDVNQAQPDGSTALHWAAHWGDLEMAELLIEAGANLNASNENGATPLWMASAAGNVAMVRTLLGAGALANRALRFGETPLMAAAGIGSLDVVKQLTAAGAEVSVGETRRAQTALMWAVAEGHSEVAQALINAGALIDARSNGGFTPLMFAAQGGHPDSIRILLASGADINHASLDGTSPLLVALAGGHWNVTELLLEHGAAPNRADNRGFTALHYAAMRSNMVPAVQPLLTYGANPNARTLKEDADSELIPVPDLPFLQAPTRIVIEGTPGGTFPIGATPFYLAAQQRNAPAMRVLVDGGADPNLATTETVYLLGDSGRRVNYVAGTTPLMAAAGADTVRTNWNDYSQAQEQQALEAIQVAVQLGSEVNAINDYGMTAMHTAAFIGSEPILEFLANNGARLDLMDGHGQTPLSIASHVITVDLRDNFDVRPRRYRQGVADLLISLGAASLEESGVRIRRQLR